MAAKNSKNTIPNSTPKADMSNSRVASAPKTSGGSDWWNNDNRAAAKRSASKPAPKPAAKPAASWPKGGSPAPGLGRGFPYRDAK